MAAALARALAAASLATARGLSLEHLTVRPWSSAGERATVCEATASTACALLEKHGCVVLKEVVPERMVEQLSESVEANFNAYRTALASRGIKDSMPFMFSEIVHRAHRRYDMKLGDQAPVPLPADTFDNAPWAPVLEKVLGHDQRLFFYGAVVSEPTARAQAQHADGGHLFYETHGKDQPHCPAHCVNVFVPLVDIADDPSLGPTEFWPGSHKIGGSYNGDGIPLAGNRGDVILFDYRVIHRGMANEGSRSRPVFYATHTRPWFSDVLNFPEERLIDSKDVEVKGGGFSKTISKPAGKNKKTKKKS